MTTPTGAVAAEAKGAHDDAARHSGTAARKSDNFFTRKYGPLPGWGWSLLAGGAALAYFWWKHRQAQQAASTTAGTTGTSTAYSGTGYAGELASIQSEIQQLQGELASTTTSTSKTTSTTKVTKPSKAPTGLKSGSVETTSATLSWSPLAQTTGSNNPSVKYNVVAWAGTGASQPTVHNSTSAATSASLTGLKAGTAYGWHVRAVNSAGDGPWSVISHFTTKKNPVMKSPAKSKLNPGGVNNPAPGGSGILNNG